MTSLPGVFAAGDIVRGASLVVWAIRDGRDAAAADARLTCSGSTAGRDRGVAAEVDRDMTETGADFVAAWHANAARAARHLRPVAGARCLRRRPGRRARRQAAPRRGAGRHRRAEGRLASRRGRCRRQDRRRRRHPCRDPAGLLRRRHRARRRQRCVPGAIARRPGVPAEDRSRRAGALPADRRDRDPALRLSDLRLAPGADQRRVHRREGQRDAARDRADHDLQRAAASTRRSSSATCT